MMQLPSFRCGCKHFRLALFVDSLFNIQIYEFVVSVRVAGPAPLPQQFALEIRHVVFLICIWVKMVLPIDFEDKTCCWHIEVN